MNKTISIYRIAVLFALGMVGFIFLFGEEVDEDTMAFVCRFIIDKALAAGALFAMVRLYKKWSKVDPWLKTYEKSCNEALDAPNPCRLKD